MARRNRGDKPSQNPYKGAGGKTPKSEHNVRALKQPAAQQDPTTEIKNRQVRFVFRHADLDSPWSLRNISSSDAAELFNFLGNTETMTVGELMSPGSGDLYIDYADMAECPNREAVDRLAELHDSPDNVCRLRLSSKKRLYGLRFGNEIAVLWWDPEHEVWPSKKKHT